MLGADLLSLARLYVPEADSTVITDANVYILLNLAAQKFVELTEALPKETTFDAVAEGQTYNISTEVTDYQKMQIPGLWWYDSGNSKWVDLKPTTIRVLDDKFPRWRDDSSGSPFRYSIDGDVITVHPKPDTSYTDGFKLYHYGISQDMAAATYPFTGSTTRYPFLADFEEDLLDYYKYRAKQIMGYGAQAEEAKAIFVSKTTLAKAQLKSRPDLTQEAHMRPKGGHMHYRHAFGTRGGRR